MKTPTLPERYERYRGTKTWRAISRGLTQLERNRDLMLQTPRGYVIGSLCECILGRARKGAKNR